VAIIACMFWLLLSRGLLCGALLLLGLFRLLRLLRLLWLL